MKKFTCEEGLTRNFKNSFHFYLFELLRQTFKPSTFAAWRRWTTFANLMHQDSLQLFFVIYILTEDLSNKGSFKPSIWQLENFGPPLRSRCIKTRYNYFLLYILTLDLSNKGCFCIISMLIEIKGVKKIRLISVIKKSRTLDY